MNREIESFFKSMDGFQEKMKRIDHDVELSKKEIENKLGSFKSQIEGIVKTDESISDTFDQLIRPIEQQIVDSTDSWDKSFMKQISSKEFRDQYIDSFLMIIYGRVKAGKSSLGNFIKEQFEKYYNCEIPIFVYTSNESDESVQHLESENSFAVANTECTASIQGFQCNGFAFIDTPGLFSENDENGELSRKYISAADYVLLPMSSTSPGTQSDIEAANELTKLGKNYNIAVTRSDKKINKKVDGSYVKDESGKIIKELTNKTKEVRKQQEDSIVKMMQERNVNIYSFDNIFSLSTHSAKESIKENNNEKLIDSNIPYLFTKLKEMISSAEELKLETPKNNLKSYIEAIIEGNNIDSISNRKKNILNVCTSIDGLKKRIGSIVELCFSDIKLEIEPLANEYLNDTISSDTLLEEIGKKCHLIFNKYINEGDELKSLNSQIELSFPDFEVDNNDEYAIKPKYKEIQYTEYYVDDGYSGNYVKEGAAMGASAGALVGGVGAGIGAAAGALIGSLKDKTKPTIKRHTVTEQIEYGNNKSEVVLKLSGDLISTVNEFFLEMGDQFTRFFLQPMEDKLSVISNAYDELAYSFNKIKETL